MGEIAEAMLDGTLCQFCGEYIGSDNGFPTSCGCDGSDVDGNSYHHELHSRKERRERYRVEKEPIEHWFLYNNGRKGDGPAFDNFLGQHQFDDYKKGKRDRTGKFLIFLNSQGATVAAVRCDEQYYPGALRKIKEIVEQKEMR